MEQINISDAELILMEHIWAHRQLKAAELARLAKAQMNWSRNTTYTLLARMLKKRVLCRTEPGFTCTPLVSKDAVRAGETNTLIDKLFEGSSRLFLASFLKREKISAQELEEIQQMLAPTEEELRHG